MPRTSNFETITSEIATAWLKQNIGNRRLREDRVLRLSREMTEGRWIANGQPIIFADTGRLLNGQHTLSAIERAGIPIELLVVRGVDEKAFPTIDTNTIRRPADDLGAMGMSNSIAAASAIRAVLIWNTGYDTPSKLEIATFAADHFDSITDAVSTVKTKLRHVMPISSAAAVVWMARHQMAGRMEVFIDQLASGANLQPGNPVLALRNNIARRRGRGAATIRGETWFNLFVHAWNHYAVNEQRSQIRSDASPNRIMGYPIQKAQGSQLELKLA